MTILQLKYLITIANSNSMREAAGKLYISQPALSVSIKELEDELGIKIFERNNKGIVLTEEGDELLAYAKQAVGQYELIEDRYFIRDKDKTYFGVSTQHYVFAVNAFARTVKQFDNGKYSFTVNETRTAEVLSNVRDMKSEVGVVSFSKNNANLFKKLFREYKLEFFPLMVRNTYIYLSKDHPLADNSVISLEELKSYPCISFDQTGSGDFYITEEALSDYDFDKMIKSNDRATSAELMAELHGYSVGTGILASSVALKELFVSVKLKEEDPLTIGYIVRKNHKLSDIGLAYINELKKFQNLEEKEEII